MASYTQEGRLMDLATPAGEDVLIIRELAGFEGISRLFHFRVEAAAENSKNIQFQQLLGQKICVSMEQADPQKKRYFSGICHRISRGGRGQVFTNYHLEIVPKFWLLTKTYQSRIFQEKDAKEILQTVLSGLDTEFQLQGSYQKRNYCVQYRESDFDFACRLMEEEGIFYFFKHESGGEHKLVLADAAQAHKDLPVASKLIYEELLDQRRDEDRVESFRKVQELRSGKYTLMDHDWKQPYKRLEVSEVPLGSVTVGTATHQIKVGANEKLEVFDYPGGYGRRPDGNVQMSDAQRTVKTLMQSDGETPTVGIEGSSTVRHLMPSYKFTLERHFQDNGEYVLTSVQHFCTQALDYRSNVGASVAESQYQNSFTCIPSGLQFKPPKTTPKPVVRGCQTAVVVGPGGEEIHTDEWGRIKVQFRWDRDGKSDENSSCWIRVATPWAGKGWGALHIPRIGHEVIVDFLEGDPDRPIVIGSVYNPDQMPAYGLPGAKTKSYLKSNSSKGSGGFNEIRFEDSKSGEQLFIHAQKDTHIRTKEEKRERVGKENHLTVKLDDFKKYDKDQHIKVAMDRNEKVGGTASLKVEMDQQTKVGMNYAVDAGMEIHLKAGMNCVIESGLSLTLKSSGGFINIGPGGIFISGQPMVFINSGGSAGSGKGSSPTAPKDAKEPDEADPGKMTSEKLEAPKPKQPFSYSPPALQMRQASKSGAAFCVI